MMPAFQRNGYQSMTLKLADRSMFDSFAAAIESDPRLLLKPQREQDYYAEQSRGLTTVATETLPSVRYQANSDRRTQASSSSDPPG